MPRIFISYRRSDSYDQTEALYKLLCRHFGEANVYRDVDKPAFGAPFPITIQQEVSRAEVVFVVIGPDWLNARDDRGRLRLTDPSDFVRKEIEIALNSNKATVIPLLLDGTPMPEKSDLPGTLRDLTQYQALTVQYTPRDFEDDVQPAINQLKEQQLKKRRRSWLRIAILVVIAAGALGAVFLSDLNANGDPLPPEMTPDVTAAVSQSISVTDTPAVPTGVTSIAANPTAVLVTVRVSGEALDAQSATSDEAFCGDPETPVEDSLTTYGIGDFVNTASLNVIALALSSDVLGWLYIEIPNPGQLLQLEPILTGGDDICRLWIRQEVAQLTQGAFSLLNEMPCNVCG